MSEPTGRILHLRDLPGLFELDLLGDDKPSLIAGNAVLAEILSVGEHDANTSAAGRIEDDQLEELAEPARSLMDVALKLAVAVRVGHWTIDWERSGYAGQLGRLLASALADVLALRAAEHVLRRELARAADKAAGTRPAGEAADG